MKRPSTGSEVREGRTAHTIRVFVFLGSWLLEASEAAGSTGSYALTARCFKVAGPVLVGWGSSNRYGVAWVPASTRSRCKAGHGGRSFRGDFPAAADIPRHIHLDRFEVPYFPVRSIDAITAAPNETERAEGASLGDIVAPVAALIGNHRQFWAWPQSCWPDLPTV